MRWVIAIVLALHGIAHLVGFAVSWQLLSSTEVPYKTTLAGGIVDVGAMGMKAVGAMWLALAVAFVLSALSVALQWPMALPVTLTTIIASLVLCAVSLPEARIGLALNVLLIIALALGPRAGVAVAHDGAPSASAGGQR
jgi:hypothetical protein